MKLKQNSICRSPPFSVCISATKTGILINDGIRSFAKLSGWNSRSATAIFFLWSCLSDDGKIKSTQFKTRKSFIDDSYLLLQWRSEGWSAMQKLGYRKPFWTGCLKTSWAQDRQGKIRRNSGVYIYKWAFWTEF